MAWEPDRRYNFFFSPPAHLCAVTYMTEISLIVTLNNQFNPNPIKIQTKCQFLLSLEHAFESMYILYKVISDHLLKLLWQRSMNYIENIINQNYLHRDSRLTKPGTLFEYEPTWH